MERIYPGRLTSEKWGEFWLVYRKTEYEFPLLWRGNLICKTASGQAIKKQSGKRLQVKKRKKEYKRETKKKIRSKKTQNANIH